MKVKRPIDEKTLGPSEWDLLLDLDRNTSTHMWGSMPIVSDVGVEYMIRLLWMNGRFTAEAMDFRTPEKKRQPIEYSVNKDTIELRFSQEQLGIPKTFDYVFLARPLVKMGEPMGAMSRLPKATYE